MIDHISIFDLAVFALMLIFGIKGLLSGIIKETFGLVGIIGGIYLASRFAQQMGHFVDINIYQIHNKASVYFIGFLSVLLIFWISSIVVGYIFTKLISLSGLGLINKLLGFVVGSLKIFLLFSIVIFALRSIDIFRNNLDKKLGNSYTYPYLVETGNYIVKLNPKSSDKIIKNIQNNTNVKPNIITNK